MQAGRLQSVKMKKAAYRNKIRREWLDSYFQERRNGLLKDQQSKMQTWQALYKRCKQIMDQLPDDNAVDSLLIEYDKNKQGVVRFMRENMGLLMESGQEMGLKAFNLYTNIVQNVAIYFEQQKKEILQATMRPIIGQGTRLIQQNKMSQQIVIKCLIEYILIMSDSFSQIDMITMCKITDILCLAFSFEPGYFRSYPEIKECYMGALETVNRFLIASVGGLHQEEDQENIDEQDEADLMLLKYEFVAQMFKKHPQNIKRIISAASVNPDNIRIVTTTLKLLTNLTYLTQQQTIYYNIFQSNVSHLIFSTLMTFPKKQQLFILVVRMVNNLLMFKKDITENIVEELHLQQLVSVYNSIKGENVELIEEMCEMLTHVVQFMEDSKSFLNYLMQKELVEILIEGCELSHSHELLPHMVFCFFILLQVDADYVGGKVRQNVNVFQSILEEQIQTASQMAKNLLDGCFKEKTQTKPSPEPQFPEPKDIQI